MKANLEQQVSNSWRLSSPEWRSRRFGKAEETPRRVFKRKSVDSLWDGQRSSRNAEVPPLVLQPGHTIRYRLEDGNVFDSNRQRRSLGDTSKHSSNVDDGLTGLRQTSPEVLRELTKESQVEVKQKDDDSESNQRRSFSEASKHSSVAYDDLSEIGQVENRQKDDDVHHNDDDLDVPGKAVARDESPVADQTASPSVALRSAEELPPVVDRTPTPHTEPSHSRSAAFSPKSPEQSPSVVSKEPSKGDSSSFFITDPSNLTRKMSDERNKSRASPNVEGVRQYSPLRTERESNQTESVNPDRQGTSVD